MTDQEACLICSRTNHTAKACYYMYDYSKEEANTDQEALVAINLNIDEDPNLYVD